MDIIRINPAKATVARVLAELTNPSTDIHFFNQIMQLSAEFKKKKDQLAYSTVMREEQAPDRTNMLIDQRTLMTTVNQCRCKE